MSALPYSGSCVQCKLGYSSDTSHGSHGIDGINGRVSVWPPGCLENWTCF